MRTETRTRFEISALIYTMTNAVLFGAGLIAVLSVPALSAQAAIAIPAVVVLCLVLAAPLAWAIAPRLRARYWRARQPREIYRLPPSAPHGA